MRKIAGVVLLRECNSALMQLRDNKPGLNAAGLWVFPGGHFEAGESAEGAARREFLEETGYECGRLFPVSSFPFPSDDGLITYQLEMFAARYDGVQPVHCYEGQRVEFVDRGHASRYPMPSWVPSVWDTAITLLRDSIVGDE
jgi:8-oxo-dGTP pyrophosphatase MutT (NUDIX family)